MSSHSHRECLCDCSAAVDLREVSILSCRRFLSSPAKTPCQGGFVYCFSVNRRLGSETPSSCADEHLGGKFGNCELVHPFSNGRASNQAKSKPGAELTELLAYSGCRLGEASALRWKPVNSPGNLLAVPDTKTESSCRVIPMSEPLRDL